MLHLIALLASSYLVFVFFAESCNPITKPKILTMRSRWKYGRQMALSVIVGMSLAIVLFDMTSVSVVLALFVGGTISIVMGLWFSMEKIVYMLRG